MKTLKELEKEIFKTESELAMSDSNDGWWNKYMKEKLEKLKKLIYDDYSRILDKKN